MPAWTMAVVTLSRPALTRRRAVSLSGRPASAARVLGRTAPGSKPASRTMLSYSASSLAGHGDREDTDEAARGGHDLIADGGIVGVEGQELFEAEANDGEGFGGLAGQRVEVEQKDADGGVGDDEGGLAAALADGFEGLADGGDQSGTVAGGEGRGGQISAGECGGGGSRPQKRVWLCRGRTRARERGDAGRSLRRRVRRRRPRGGSRRPDAAGCRAFLGAKSICIVLDLPIASRLS